MDDQTPRRRSIAAEVSATRVGSLLALLAVLGCWFAASAAATTLTNYTWTGAADGDGWALANWSPSGFTGADLGVLSFPDLPSCVTGVSACYSSVDELPTDVSASGIDIDDAVGYGVSADQAQPLLLGAGGFNASPATSANDKYPGLGWSVPIALGAAQNWTVTGDGSNPYDTAITFDGAVTQGGPTPSADTLGITLGADAQLTFFSAVNTAGLTLSGADPDDTGGASMENGQVFANDLDGDSDTPVTLNNVQYAVEAAANSNFETTETVGPLTVTDGSLVVGIPDNPSGILQVNGALSLGANSASEFTFVQGGSVPNTDFGQIKAAGNVTIGGMLDVTAANCSTLGLGDTATFITTTGQLSGSFSNAPEGAVIPITSCSSNSALAVQINYTDDSMTATTVSAAQTATVLSAAPSDPAPGQSTTLTAAVTVGSLVLDGPGQNNGTVEFLSDGTPIPGCTAQPVTAADFYQGEAVCTSSFAAPTTLTAVYTPAFPQLNSSSSAALALSVGGVAPSGSGSSSGSDNSPTTTGGSSTNTGGGSSSSAVASPEATALASESSRAAVARTSVTGSSTSVSLSCSGGISCALTLALSVNETTSNQLTAADVNESKSTKPKKRTVSLGSVSVKLAAGAKRTVKLSLNAAGKRLLKRFHRLAVKLVVTNNGKQISSRTLHFR